MDREKYQQENWNDSLDSCVCLIQIPDGGEISSRRRFKGFYAWIAHVGYGESLGDMYVELGKPDLASTIVFIASRFEVDFLNSIPPSSIETRPAGDRRVRVGGCC